MNLQVILEEVATLVKLNLDRQRSNMRFGMSVSMFRLNIIGMTPVVVLVV